MKNALLLLSLLVGHLAIAAYPTALHLQCASTEIGTIDLKLVNPQQLSISPAIQYYDADVARLDAKGSVIETAHYTVKQQSDDFKAELDGDSNAFYFRIPIGVVDWTQNDQLCFAQANSPGVWFDIDSSTLKLTDVGGGDGPILILQALNPRAEERQIAGFPFGSYWPFLDGRKCSQQLGNSSEATDPIVCKQISN